MSRREPLVSATPGTVIETTRKDPSLLAEQGPASASDMTRERRRGDEAREPKCAPRIARVRARALRLPTQTARECDGSLCWAATEMLVVEVDASGVTGLGYSYTQASAARSLVQEILAPLLHEANAFDLPRLWQRMNAALRNTGRPGLGLMALSAVDIALWDLKARLLGVPLTALWGRAREAVPVYGSGGFTNYGDEDLQRQLGGWRDAGLRAVKIKVGSNTADDPRRVRLARQAIGDDVALMVDANGACDRVQALQLSERLAEQRVSWFEEPVSSDDLDGLRWLVERAPAGMAIAAGEYAGDVTDFRRLLEGGAVGVLQADATRCGYTGFLQAAALCEAFHTPLSAHCAPAIHAPLCAAVRPLRHLEYFHDHQHFEQRLFDGLPDLRGGALWPANDAPGHGLKLKAQDAEALELR